jgi:hypothetical protein
MKTKTCATCQYCRLRAPGFVDLWCSNSKSPKLNQSISPTDTSTGYTRRGKKAPLGIRVANKALGWVRNRIGISPSSIMSGKIGRRFILGSVLDDGDAALATEPSDTGWDR